MAAPASPAWFDELCARGRLDPAAPPLPLAPGNQDRRPDRARAAWRVRLADGRPAKLTVGRSLGALVERSAAFAAACPDIAAAPLFHDPLAEGEAFAEAFLEGVPLETAAPDSPASASATRGAIGGVLQALAATEQPSTDGARSAEWQAWADEIVRLPVWTNRERDHLVREILPALRQPLCVEPPVTRWSNGDFLAANILVTGAGATAHLVDTEFAARTHFFREDWARLRILSACARTRPDLVEGVLPDAGLDWHLFFWLRQLGLEAAQNTPEYLARVLPGRRAIIRRLAEHLFALTLDGWSGAPAAVIYNVEEASWKTSATDAFHLRGWCHVPGAPGLQAVAVVAGQRCLRLAAPCPRPDVQAHVGGDPQALRSGFELAVPPAGASAVLSVVAVSGDGTWLPFAALRPDAFPVRSPFILGYRDWAALHDPDPPASWAVGSRTRGSPRFSVLLPVYNTPERLVRACIASVRDQHYRLWELVIINDASTNPETGPLLASLAAADTRIRLLTRPQNGGISRATNDALAAARHPYVVLLDHDDRLRPHALVELARWIAAAPAADVLYSDEEKITADGERAWPFLKPDFSPEYLLGVMYPGHVLCVRTAVARAAGGFDPAFDGIQDYEFFLRLTERTRRIYHLPRILYQWRLTETSSALTGNIKGDMDQLQAEAVRAHLARIRRPRVVTPIGGHRLRLSAAPEAVPPPVSVVIAPSAAGARSAEELCALLNLRDESTQVGATPAPGTAADSDREVLIFLETIPTDPPAGWTAALASLAAIGDSGAVAPVLLSTTGTVLESGWTVGLGIAAPLMRGFDASEDGYNGSLPCNREVSAVSGRCLAVRRDRLARAGVLAPNFVDPWWALDLCLRLQAAGFRNRVAASVRLRTGCPESLREASGEGWPSFAGRWRDRLRLPDPYYNLHFDPAAGDYRLARQPGLQPGPGQIPQALLRYHIDAPATFRLRSPFLRMHGWCFSPGRQLQAVRLRLPDRELPGNYGTGRPDVPQTIPEAPGDAVGFELWTRVPRGRHEAVLEFQDTEGAWHRADALPLRVPRWSRPRWLPGVDPEDLVAFQLPVCPIHPPHPVRPERFPQRQPYGGPLPRLAIVTPSFNQARFISATLASVAAPPHVAIHHVVQDGGSTDGTLRLLQAWAERHPAASPAGGDAPRRFAWESAPDRGQADAVARGFARTTGGPEDLMAWINSDDCFIPGALGFVADWFARHPDVDVVYGNRIVVDEHGREIGRWYLPPHDDELLRINDFVPQETLFWRRRLWDRAGGVDPRFEFALDWDLLLRFRAAGARIVHLPYFLACFRAHRDQKTARIKVIGQPEIERLRERALGRRLSITELAHHPRLIGYLRRSAWIEFLAKLGIRR